MMTHDDNSKLLALTECVRERVVHPKRFIILKCDMRCARNATRTQSEYHWGARSTNQQMRNIFWILIMNKYPEFAITLCGQHAHMESNRIGKCLHNIKYWHRSNYNIFQIFWYLYCISGRCQKMFVTGGTYKAYI